MASLNKLTLIGRLTRDPETKTFTNGTKVANFGFAVSDKKKDSLGNWVDDPLFLDCAAFNSQYKRLADLVEQYLRKGSQVYLEGKLKLEQWTSQDGQKRSKHKLMVFDVQFLDTKTQGERQDSAPVQQDNGGGNIQDDDGEIPF